MEKTKKMRACLLVSENAIRYCVGREGRIFLTGRVGRNENIREILRAVPGLFSESENPEMCLMPDTGRVCLVPRAWFEREDAERYLALGGMTVAPDDELVVTEPVGGIVAAMYVGGETWRRTRELFPGASAVHPLQVSAAWKRSSRPAIEAFLVGGSVALTAFSGDGLLCARVQPCRSDADLLYYLNRLRVEYPRLKFRIGICGEGASEAVKAAARYFPRVSRLRMPSRGVSGDAASEILPLIRLCHENY